MSEAASRCCCASSRAIAVVTVASVRDRTSEASRAYSSRPSSRVRPRGVATRTSTIRRVGSVALPASSASSRARLRSGSSARSVRTARSSGSRASVRAKRNSSSSTSSSWPSASATWKTAVTPSTSRASTRSRGLLQRSPTACVSSRIASGATWEPSSPSSSRSFAAAGTVGSPSVRRSEVSRSSSRTTASSPSATVPRPAASGSSDRSAVRLSRVVARASRLAPCIRPTRPGCRAYRP